VVAVAAYRRFGGRDWRRGVAAGLAPIAAVGIVVPLLTPATATAGSLSPDLVFAYRGLVVFGQAGLWAGLAAAFSHFDTESRRLAVETHETQV